MRKLTAVLGILMLVSASAAAQGGGVGGGRGQGGPPGGRGGRGGPEEEHAMACRVGADSLSDAQKEQVHALAQQFEAAHKSTLDSLKALAPMGRGRGGGDAQAARPTPEEMKARMDVVRGLQESLKPAHEQWRESLKPVLSQSQRDHGCFPPAPGGPPPGGRRGGPPPDGDRH